MKNKIKVIASLLIVISSLGLVACDNNNSSKTEPQILPSNSEKITNYSQLLSAFKNGDKFLVKYYINRDYSEEKLKATNQGLKSVSNSLYIHHFSSGELESNGDIQFSGSKKWVTGEVTYLHTYKYLFKASNNVSITGNDTLITMPVKSITPMESTATYDLTGNLGKSVEVYSYK